jgi:tRNA 2-selenouridine synthase
MCRAPLVVVEVPQEARAEQIRTDYVQDLWLRYLEMYGPDAGWPLFAAYLTDAMAGSSADSVIRIIASWMP